MPDLPTITVSSAQATRLMELFGDVASYKKWLKAAVREEARRLHAVALTEVANQSVRDGLAVLETELPEPDPEPEPEPPLP